MSDNTAKNVPIGSLRGGHMNMKVPPDHVEPRSPGAPRPRQNVVEGGPLVKAVVARGRTVEVGTGERVVTGLTADGKEVCGQRCRSVGPGGQVELPAEEVARLRNLGYLVDPDKIAPPVGDGPQYS